jgi:hypothetical protein
LIKLQDAQIAQIRGGFINIVGYLRKNIECLIKLQDAPIAQIRGGFINWVWYICGSGCVGRNYGARLFILEKTEHIYYVDSFKLVFDIL